MKLGVAASSASSAVLIALLAGCGSGSTSTARATTSSPVPTSESAPSATISTAQAAATYAKLVVPLVAAVRSFSAAVGSTDLASPGLASARATLAQAIMTFDDRMLEAGPWPPGADQATQTLGQYGSYAADQLTASHPTAKLVGEAVGGVSYYSQQVRIVLGVPVLPKQTVGFAELP